MGVSSPCALLQLGRLSLTTSSSVEMDSARPQNGGWGEGLRPNGFLGLALNDRNILFLMTLLDKAVSVG